MSQFDELIHDLTSSDPDVRRETALKLGALRDPRAIPALVDLYNDDPDPTVRKAAERSLRVFRRMERETLAGAGGEGRQPRARRSMSLSVLDMATLAAVSLIGLVIVIVGLAFLLSRHMVAAPTGGSTIGQPVPTPTVSTPLTPTITPTPTPGPDELALTHIRAMREIVANAEQSAAQIVDIWTRVSNGERPCDVPCCIEVPQSYRIPEADARRLPSGLGLADEVRNLNRALDRLKEAIDTWMAECSIERSPDAAVPPAVATTGLGIAEEAMWMLNDVGRMLALMEDSVAAGELPPTRTPTPAPVTPTPE